MRWAKLPSSIYYDDRFLRLSDAAFRLFINGMAVASHRETDGFIARSSLRLIGGTERSARALVAAGLWTEVQDGFSTDWSEQESKSARTSERLATSLRVQKLRESQASPPCNAVTEPVTNAVTTPPREEKRREEKNNPPVVPPLGDQPDHVPALKPRRAPQRTGLPVEWSPSDSHRELARKLGVACDTEAAAFRDFHASKGNTFADWNLAFNTWLRNAPKFSGAPRTPPPAAIRQNDGGRVPQWAIDKGLVRA